jgi:TorA maturation chaperone TorD
MRLQAYLEQERLSASQFAGRIGRAVSTVTRIINGETTPEPETIAKIVAATGGAVQPNDLFFAARQFDRLAGAGVAEEELVRADFYGLLARFLGGPPSNELLASAAALSGDASELGSAVSALAAEASLTSTAAAAREYQDLFIGLGRGELIPYASYYMTGFLNEKPLAVLRGDLARLGVARADGAKEPEDNIAALCEVMGGLIGGAFGEPAALAEQRRFFRAHLAPWAPRFFGDLEAAQSAKMYRPIGTIGRLFMEVEQAAFAMDA